MADEFAEKYDEQVSANQWKGPEIMFRNLNEFLTPRAKILDLGIGTGESSVRFVDAGHIISGIDGSSRMLEICSFKNIREVTFMAFNNRETNHKYDFTLVLAKLKPSRTD